MELIQIIISFISTLCFGILFNLKGKKLVTVAFGGLISWSLFLLISNFIESETINYFIVAVIVSLYSEIMARILKTPATPLVTTSLIPLIPGGSLYYTMSYAFENNYDGFIEKAISTLKLASALALGIIIITALSQFIFKKLSRKSA